MKVLGREGRGGRARGWCSSSGAKSSGGRGEARRLAHCRARLEGERLIVFQISRPRPDPLCLLANDHQQRTTLADRNLPSSTL